jgi:hypothetical protein
MIVTASNSTLNSHAIKGKFRSFLLCTSRGVNRKNEDCFIFSKGEQIKMTRSEAANAIRYARN